MTTVNHIPPMLATHLDDLPTGSDWIPEFKWDGHRGQLAAGDGWWRLISREGRDITGTYPEVGTICPMLGRTKVILDGEIVALDPGGAPDIELLQQRANRGRPHPSLIQRIPVAFIAFDLLGVDGRSLLAEPYIGRRAALKRFDLECRPQILVPPLVDLPPDEALKIARKHRLEGLVCKRRRSLYQPGVRSASWRAFAIRTLRTIVIGGWRTGPNRELGSLMMGAYNVSGRLAYLGDVGSGVPEETLAYLLPKLKRAEQSSSSFTGSPDPKNAHWVEPKLTARVEYGSQTWKGRLRYTAWKGLLVDQPIEDVML